MNGAELRDEGIEQVLRNEEEDWIYRYKFFAAKTFEELDVGSVFSSETISEPFRLEAGEPHHPGVWGAVFRTVIIELKNNRQVEDAGWTITKRPTSHHRPTRLYRRVR